MEDIVAIIDNREQEIDDTSDKTEDSEEIQAEELNAETFDIQHDNKETSPLLRLPGKIRNEIYGYLTLDCDVEIHYEPKGDLVSAHECYVFSEEDLKSVDVVWVYTEEHMALFQINSQIRGEAHSYILDHCSFWIDQEDLVKYRVKTDEHVRLRNLVIDMTNGSSTSSRDYRRIGDSLGTLCTEGRLENIVVFEEADVDTPNWVMLEYVYPGRFSLAEYLRVTLHSGMVGREVSVETDWEWTGVPKWESDSDSDSNYSDYGDFCQADFEHYYGTDSFWNSFWSDG